jgi:hypothetical protein
MHEGAGDRGPAVAKTLQLAENSELNVGRSTLVVTDEASMVDTPN